ncbi:hypothetical protein C4J81_19130 (plasmid) [Deltaproteobacteria bacterium Smac51]|nr:hypothetical protein C4J81_19130 [Deltaproteobacteria bacterium Smac51]
MSPARQLSEEAELLNRLTALVGSVNTRLDSRWRARLGHLGGLCGAWVSPGLSGRGGPFIAELTVTIDGYEPLKMKSVFSRKKPEPDARPVLRLGPPGLWRRLMRLYRPCRLTFQITNQHGRPVGRLIIAAPKEAAEGDKL